MNQDIDKTVDDGSVDQATMDRLTGFAPTGEVQAEVTDQSALVTINNPVVNTEEADAPRGEGVVVNPVRIPEVQVQQLPGGLVQYNYTVR